jgi:hypothetical protein
MRLYTTTNGVEYNSFLDCIIAEKKSVVDFDPFAVMEFLTFGSVYGNKTFFKNIKKETTHQPYRLDEDMGLVSATKKDKNPLRQEQSVNAKEAMKLMIDFFVRRKKWLTVQKVSVDLTGGIDSRLIASILLYLDIPFQVVFSMSSGSEGELKIVGKLTDEVNLPLKVIPSPDSYSSKEEIEKLIKLGDGQWDPTGLRSLYNSQHWRKIQGYDLALTGVGGELYKDFWWLQDLPFYQSSRPDFDRLLSMRMYPSTVPEELLGIAFEQNQDDYLRDFKSHLSFYHRETNTQTYDQVYYHLRIKEQISVLSHASATFLPVWSPLLDPELLRIGYNLRRRDRFLSWFHRTAVTECAPALSKISTTDGGMTVSKRQVNVASDMIKFIRHKSGRMLTRLKKDGTKTEQLRVCDPIFRDEICGSIQNLKKVNILSEHAPDSPEMYSENLHGRLVLLGYLAGLIDA